VVWSLTAFGGAGASRPGAGRRMCLATYEYDTCASCSSTNRSKIRCAVCRCFGGASRSAANIASISPRTCSNTGAARTGRRRSGGKADSNACRTVRRCTSYLRANARIDSPPRCRSNLIAANSSTLVDPIPAPSKTTTGRIKDPPTRPSRHHNSPGV